MDHIEYIADLDEEKPIKFSKAEREHILKKNDEEEAKEQALENPYENGISTVLEAFNELDREEEPIGEICGQVKKTHFANGWTTYIPDDFGYIQKFLNGYPAGLTFKVIDDRNKDGYGTIYIIIHGKARDYGLDIFKDPVDNKEKYYFNMKDNASGLGKTCYITDENPKPNNEENLCCADYWNEDPELEAINDPWSI